MLREYGHARRGWLGVSIQQVTPDIAESLGLKRCQTGALVGRVNDGWPRGQGRHQGLATSYPEVRRAGREGDAGPATHRGRDRPSASRVPVLNCGATARMMTLQATVGELPDDVQQASATPGRPRSEAGPQYRDRRPWREAWRPSLIGSTLRSQFKLLARPEGSRRHRRGLQDGPAATRGLKPGDVIVEVQQQPVATPDDGVRSDLQRYKKQNRKTVLMLVQSGDGMRWIPLPLNQDDGRKPG